MAAFLGAAHTQSVTQSHFMTPFYIILFFSQLILHRGQTSRHFPGPDLFFSILDEINLHVVGEVLGCTGEKNLHWGKKSQRLAMVYFVEKTAYLESNFLKTVLTDSLNKTRDPDSSISIIHKL